MLSKKQVSNAIDNAEQEFLWVWNVLKAVGEPKSDGNRILEVQNRLIEALWILDALYRRVLREKERLIKNKHGYNSAWFSRRMAKCASYLKLVKDAIGVGKALGDGYAWIFYQRENALINEHLRCQRQINLPPTIGRIGERAFVEKLQGLYGHFVLYHGITSFLRLGDVSFIDPEKGQVVSVGELKTKRIGEHEYQITLGVIYGRGFNMPPQSPTSTVASKPESLPQSMLDRQKRQMKAISGALRQADRTTKKATSIGINGQYHFAELGQALKACATANNSYIKAGKSLLIGAISVPGKRLSSRLLRDPDPNLNKKIDPVLEGAKSICDHELKDNCIFVSTVGYGTDSFPFMLSGTMPMLWWPVETAALYDLIFGRSIAITVYNPAHLWAALRKRGFAVSVDAKSRVSKVERPAGERTLGIHNMDYFHWLTSHFLMSDNDVLELIDRSLELVRSEGTVPFRMGIAPIMAIRP